MKFSKSQTMKENPILKSKDLNRHCIKEDILMGEGIGRDIPRKIIIRGM